MVDINHSWELILQDFNNFEPFLATLLSETLPSKSDYTADPYDLTITFPFSKEANYEYFTSNRENVVKFVDYLQEILDKAIRLSIKLEAVSLEHKEKVKEQHRNANSKDYLFILEKEKYPLLQLVQDYFNTDFKGTYTIEAKKPETKDKFDEHAEDA